ncbi:MAG TPA: aldehyde dehydrogenase family protein, partial [Arthrobacter sp.]|nr:aldehyde dehydrogenase family protein [Arthrobacter sp.]
MPKQRAAGAVTDRGRELAATLAALVASPPDRPVQASRAPFDDTLLGEVPVSTEDDVRAAVDTARMAQELWAGQPLAARRAVVARFIALLLDREQDILDLVQAESGKSRLSAFEEFADV